MKGTWPRRAVARQAVAIVGVSLVSAFAVTGCDEESSKARPGALTLTITRDFGREVLSRDENLPLRGQDTLLRQLEKNHDVESGKVIPLVRAIDGVAQSQRIDPEDPQDETDETTQWVTNVNGLETDPLPPEFRLHAGDVVQWDLRDWEIVLSVRATVGAFPQPFTGGMYGERFPTKLRCTRPSSLACRRVRHRLREAGIALDGPPAKPNSKGSFERVLNATIHVGAWDELLRRKWGGAAVGGPDASGIFARFSSNGDSLQLFDWNTKRVRVLGAGTGLVAAVLPTNENLKWYVTGVDEAGVKLAAQALDRETLRDAFAVAVTPAGVEKLPVPPR